MARYNGWGGMPDLFSGSWGYSGEPWKREAHRVIFDSNSSRPGENPLMTRDERQSASRSTPNAHFTAPELCRRIWRTVQSLGFDGGAVLEPSAGVGNFLGTMPEELIAKSSITAVEKDDLTGRMLRMIYPDATVNVCGFEDMDALKGTQDLVITNVPFGSYQVYDHDYRGDNMSIHNYFAVKALDCLKPGGIAALITSRYTMDSESRMHRMMIHDRGRMAGMIRLPSRAHQAQANTQVVTDILFFVRDPSMRKAGDLPVWVDTEDEVTVSNAEGDDFLVTINRHVLEHPDVVVGREIAVQGMHHEGEYSVEMEKDAYFEFLAVDEPLPGIHRPAESPPQPDEAQDSLFDSEDLTLATVFRPVDAPDYYGYGSILIDDSGTPVFVLKASKQGDNLVLQVEKCPAKNAKDVDRLIGFVAIKSAYRDLVRLQIAKASDEEKTAARKLLNDVYDDFFTKHGPINKRSNYNLFKADPESGKIVGLEIYDKKKGTAVKAQAFYSDTIMPTLEVPEHVESLQEALICSINHTGRVDLPFMAKITKQPEIDIEYALVDSSMAFRNPTTGEMEIAALYLSGNVREKLNQAIVAARTNGDYGPNVAALDAVIPKDVPAEEIDAEIGQAWILENIVRGFIENVALKTSYIRNLNIEHYKHNNEWNVTWDERNTNNPNHKFRTKDVNARKMLNMALNGKLPVVRIKIDDKLVTDADATAEATEVMKSLKAAFVDYLWEPERKDRMVRAYNDTHNSYVKPVFDGSGLVLHGMAVDFLMRKHQLDAIMRSMMMCRALYGHDVGSGKTAVQIATAMQAKMFGMAARPMIVVPNSMLEQITRESQQLYPNARILAISKDDLKKEKLKNFLGRAANNDWDIVITTHGALNRIAVPREYDIRVTQEEIARFRAALSEGSPSESGGKRRIKQIETRIARLENRLEALSDVQNVLDGVTLQDIGVDLLMIDESHNFKNLEIPSTEDFAQGISGSAKAWDLYKKIQYIHDLRGNQTGVFFSSATPVSNNILELYNIQRYLQQDILEETGLHSPEAWARVYLKEIITWEPDPGGTGWRQKARYALRNAPELVRSLHQVMDVVHADDIGIVRPGSIRTNIVLEQTPEELGIMETLAGRTIAIREGLVKPWEDNMLLVVTTGRKLALDPRLIEHGSIGNPESDDDLDIAAYSVEDRADKGNDDVYDSDTDDGNDDDDIIDPIDLEDTAIASVLANGEEINPDVVEMAQEFEVKAQACGLVAAEIYRKTEAVKGAQLIFCDFGTPGKDKPFVLYDEIRKELVRNGIPNNEIAFVQTAKTDKDKAILFEAVRNGDIRILIGSTAKMGEGLNVQKRLAALHHLDPPWRPSDIEQREGRVIRFANMFKSANLITYTKKGSFDEFMWNTLKRKYDQFRQILAGDGNIRTFDSDVNPTYAETLALTTGNPLLKERLELEQEVSYLSSLKRQAQRREQEERHRIRMIREEIGDTKDKINVIKMLPDMSGRDIRVEWELAPFIMDALKRNEAIESGGDIADEDTGAHESGDWSAVPETASDQVSLFDSRKPGNSIDLDQTDKTGTRQWVTMNVSKYRKHIQQIDANAGRNRDGDFETVGIWCAGIPVTGRFVTDKQKPTSLSTSRSRIQSAPTQRWVWTIGMEEIEDHRFMRLYDLEDYIERNANPQALRANRIHIRALEEMIENIAPQQFEHEDKLRDAQRRLDWINKQIEGGKPDGGIEIITAEEPDDDDIIDDDDDDQAVGVR